MAPRIGTLLLFLTLAVSVRSQTPDLAGMILTLEREVTTLDHKYLQRVAESHPFLIIYWHYLHTQSWEMRIHPSQKETPTSIPVIDADSWHRHSLVDLEMQGVVQRQPEQESLYRIGEEQRFVALSSSKEVLKNVNALYTQWIQVNATQE